MPYKIMGGDSFYVIKMYGELIVNNISQFKIELKEFVAQLIEEKKTTPIIFDMMTLRYVDSSGVGALIDTKKLLEYNNIKYGFYNVPNDIIRMLEVTKLLSYFPIYKNEQEAKSAILNS